VRRTAARPAGTARALLDRALGACRTAAAGAARAPACAALLAGLVLAPAPAAAQADSARDTTAAMRDTTTAAAPTASPSATGAPLYGWALLAYDGATGQLGIVAATDRFSSGSGVPFLEPGAGAVAALGRLDPAAGRAALRALSRGRTAAEAVAAGTGGGGGGAGTGAPAGAPQVAALTPGCSAAAGTPPDLVPWSGSVRNSAGGTSCWILAGSGLADSTLLGRLEGVYGRTGGDLLDRFTAVLDAAGRAESEAPRTRSAVVWIVTPPGGTAPLGRHDLRLQVEDVQRPADALAAVVDAGRADDLAARAERSVDAGDYEGALELAGRAIDLQPQTGLAWLARGRALLFTGRADEAETAFQRMLEVDPWLLHVLGDPVRGTVRQGVIPYRPRLLQRLDVYRRAFWPDVTFPDADAAGGG